MSGLPRITGLVLRELTPLAAIVAVLLAMLLAWFVVARGALKHKPPSVDHLIVETQLDRLREGKPSEVALLGDSSCLMGIVAPQLHDELKIEVQNYCTIGYVGPAGYAVMIDDMSASGGWIILAIHPIQFTREAAWDSWVAYVTPSGAQTARDPLSIRNALAFARESLSKTVVYDPLPGRFALYYGGTGTVRRELKMSRGSMLDPGYGLGVGSLELLEAQTDAPGFGSISNVNPNAAFLDALAVFAARIRRIDYARVLLLVTPVPAGVLGAGEHAQLKIARDNIALQLGLLPDDVLDLPLQMPAVYFSSQTHLNRWGRERYTQLLAKSLRARVDAAAPRSRASELEERASSDRPSR